MIRLMICLLILMILRRSRAYRKMLEKQMAFYDVAGEWFYNKKSEEN